MTVASNFLDISFYLSIAGVTMTTRIEKDGFGDIEVPEQALYGAGTARSMINFPIGGSAEKMPVCCDLSGICNISTRTL